MKTNAFIPQDDIDMHNLNLEFYLIESVSYLRDTSHPPSSKFHGPLYLDSLNQSASPSISSNTLDFQSTSPNGDQVHSGHIPQTGSKSV